MLTPLRWENNTLYILDQTRLPRETVYLECRDYPEVAAAIKRLSVRGAPAIGAAAAYGLLVGIIARRPSSGEEVMAVAESIARELAATRPTAVNLSWALKRMLERLKTEREAAEKSRLPATDNSVQGKETVDGERAEVEFLIRALAAEAQTILEEDVAGNRRMGRFGQELISDGARILTHCNAGALATAGYGTALGVVRAAVEAGKRVHVYADETRPLLQGARLTTYELMADGIPVTLITDNMAGYLMARGMVDLVIVGADRIAANGDTANKIGTYGVAVLARYHGIPFYVAAPLSTFDLSLTDGSRIPIEERAAEEVTSFAGQPVAPAGVSVWNPAFDITPAELITAIITDHGVLRPPYRESIAELWKKMQK